MCNANILKFIMLFFFVSPSMSLVHDRGLQITPVYVRKNREGSVFFLTTGKIEISV
jgi:hypothetical protein